MRVSFRKTYLYIVYNFCLKIQANFNFSSRTTSLDVQMSMEANVAKRNKNIYGPPVGKKLVCFIDDMNMPQVDTYGTQQPIALLKLFLELGGMYDRGKDLGWKYFVDICKFHCSVSIVVLLTVCKKIIF